MEILILTAEDVNSALPMAKAIDAMQTAFSKYSSGETTMPHRSSIETGSGVTLLMPAYLPGSQNLTVKLVSIYDQNLDLGLSRISAIVLAINPQTGRPIALIDGGSLTALRTGAAGGLAAKILSRRNSKCVALFGAGIQGRTQLQAVMEVRPIEKIFIFDLNPSISKNLAREIADWPHTPEVIIADSPAQAVMNADIVVTATPSKAPVFNGGDIRPGTHITAIGGFTPEMREVDETFLKKATIVVDSREACLDEAGDLILANTAFDTEIGEIINGQKPARESEEEITFFKSVGLAVQDAAASAIILAEAEKKGLGSLINL